MNEEITLYGDKQHLVDILESHIVDLLAKGYAVGEHVELDYCWEFLIQLDDSHPILEEFNKKDND